MAPTKFINLSHNFTMISYITKTIYSLAGLLRPNIKNACR